MNTCTMPYTVFPLGIAHLATALQVRGYDVLIADLNKDGDGLSERIAVYGPDFIGISIRNIDDMLIQNTRSFIAPLSDVVAAARSVSQATVILGGSAFSLFPERLLRICGADFGICGEAEGSLPDLLLCIENGISYESISGLVYRKGEAIVVNPKRVLPPADIPAAFRPRELADYYIRSSTMLNVQTQRGCAFTCCYCSYPLIEGTCVRYRSVESVCGELKAIQEAGAHYVFIVDSVFNTSGDHVAAVCEALIANNITVHWGCFLRPQGITQDLMDLMARAGLRHIEFGTDSLCDTVLEAYGKSFTFADILHAGGCARKAGVYQAHFLIIGGPSENERTILEGFENAKQLKKTVFFPYIGMRILPGTALHATALREGVVHKETDLLSPRHYVSAAVSQKRIEQLLQEQNARARNWIAQETPPAILRVREGLRQKGVIGPLWEFLVR